MHLEAMEHSFDIVRLIEGEMITVVNNVDAKEKRRRAQIVVDMCCGCTLVLFILDKLLNKLELARLKRNKAQVDLVQDNKRA